jgi:hypothetical protein
VVPVVVWILQREPGPFAGPLERLLAAAATALAARHVDGFRVAGAADARIVAGPPDDTPFGARLRNLVRGLPRGGRGRGVVVLGSGSLPLATADDRRAFVAVAASGDPVALANVRHSADAIAVGRAEVLADLPDLPSDNALPRWLAEHAHVQVSDLGLRRRLAFDLDSPLDLLVLARSARLPTALRALADAELPGPAGARLDAVATVAVDRTAELLVAGRTSASTLRLLEREVPARVRALVEERGLRASSPLAQGAPRASRREPASVLGLLLDRDGPESFGPLLARLGDCAIVDTRVLLAHRLGADERAWPSAEDRFASDLLMPGSIADPWLRTLTESALGATIPVALGGHTLVGPGLLLALTGRGGPRAPAGDWRRRGARRPWS